MIRLSGDTEKLQAFLAGAVATTQPDVMVSFKDAPVGNDGQFGDYVKARTLSGASTVDICDAPVRAAVREIEGISIRNNDTASVTLTVQLLSGSTARQIIAVTLLTGEHLFYSHVHGWQALAADGQLKVIVPSLTVGDLLVTGNLTVNGNTILGNAATDTLNVGAGGIIKDASGNVGIGVTPGAWDSSAGSSAIQVGTRAMFAGLVSGTQTYVGNNLRFDGTNWKYLASDEAALYVQASDGAHYWYGAASGIAGNTISLVERLRIYPAGGLQVPNANAITWLNNSGTPAFNVQLYSDNNAYVDNYYGVIFFRAGSAGALNASLALTSDGRFYGTALHNNAGAITGTTNQYVASVADAGPVPANFTNCTTASATYFIYNRTGNVVTGQLRANSIDVTAAGFVQFTVALPINSNLTSATDLLGVGVAWEGAPANIVPVKVIGTVADLFVVEFIAPNGNTYDINISFSYEIK